MHFIGSTLTKNVAEQLRLEDGAQLHEFDGNTVIVLVGNVTKATATMRVPLVIMLLFAVHVNG